MSKFIQVEIADLAALADLICDRDTGKVPPTTENIGACHDLIMKMMGEHVHKYYADDDGTELLAALKTAREVIMRHAAFIEAKACIPQIDAAIAKAEAIA